MTILQGYEHRIKLDFLLGISTFADRLRNRSLSPTRERGCGHRSAQLLQRILLPSLCKTHCSGLRWASSAQDCPAEEKSCAW